VPALHPPTLLAVLHHDQRADLEADRHGVFGAGDLDFLAFFVQQLDLRTQGLGQRTAALRIDRHQGRQTGHFVDLASDGDALFHVLERIVPAYSVMIGRVSGSQVARAVPALMTMPSLTIRVAPYGTL
jgi:hypothetical protein